MASADKHHLVDPALAARLLNVTAAKLLSGRDIEPSIPRVGPFLGALFESLVALNLRVYSQAAEAEVRHLRTRRGEHEIDFIVIGPDDGVVAVEVKLAAIVSDNDVKHLHWLRDRIGDQLLDAVLVTTGTAAYRREDGIAVVPAALLGP
ncbi:MAG: DUF4143 domain-containing protein [Nocardioides sp.]